jgi:predicted GNAT superfamily acetyltransferase
MVGTIIAAVFFYNEPYVKKLYFLIALFGFEIFFKTTTFIFFEEGDEEFFYIKKESSGRHRRSDRGCAFHPQVGARMRRRKRVMVSCEMEFM